MDKPTRWIIIPLIKQTKDHPHVPLGEKGMGWLVINSDQKNKLFQGSGECIAKVKGGDHVTFVGTMPTGGHFVYMGEEDMLSHSDMTLIKDKGQLHFMTQYTIDSPYTGDSPSDSGLKRHFQISLDWDEDKRKGQPKGTLTGTLNVSVGGPH